MPPCNAATRALTKAGHFLSSVADVFGLSTQVVKAQGACVDCGILMYPENCPGGVPCQYYSVWEGGFGGQQSQGQMIDANDTGCGAVDNCGSLDSFNNYDNSPYCGP